MNFIFLAFKSLSSKKTFKVSAPSLIFFTSAFILFFGNKSFFENVFKIYPLEPKNALFIFSLFIVFFFLNVILLSLFSYGRLTKVTLISFLLVSSLAAYFMDAYHIIIDDSMIDNLIKTDTAEASDLLSFMQFTYFFAFGIAPSFLIYKSKIKRKTFTQEVISKLKLIGLSALVLVLTLLSFGSNYASFLREHKPLRFYANPTFYVYSLSKYVGSFIKSKGQTFKEVGLDAKIAPPNNPRKLIVFILGETARADHFSLNGYYRETQPLLSKKLDAGEIISFKNVWACGTSTAYSLPCLFSNYNRSNFKRNEARTTENVLDVLKRSGVNVLWVDNNSSSKGVADRVSHESYKMSDKNKICTPECRDEGMLERIESYVQEHPVGDIFIILHQMGNHGPSYYKRYPSEFEKFTPVCKTNQLEKCSRDEIINAYDNVLLYTDFFLNKSIDVLKKYSPSFQTSMLYISDHGESLGESGLYLHGLPYMIAPDTQKHVPLIMWFGESFKKKDSLLKNIQLISDHKFSHDNIFHTILGLFNVSTEVYKKNMDILKR